MKLLLRQQFQNPLKKINILGYFTAYKFNSFSVAVNDLIYICKYKINPFPFQTLNKRVDFRKFLINMQDHYFLSKIIWTDKSYFPNEGIVNTNKLNVWV